MFKKSSLAIAAVLLASSASSFAATAPANFNVTATLNPVCTVSASNISLAYTSFGPEVSNTGALTVQCTQGQAYNLAVNSNPNGNSVLGLTYSIVVMSGANVNPTGLVGTGTAETDKVVKVTIGGGQSGQVSGLTAGQEGKYSASVQHTVTVTY